MGSATSHRVGGTARVRFTVAELLDQRRHPTEPSRVPDRSGTPGAPGSVPAGRPGGGSVRRRLVAVAGTAAVAATLAGGAVPSATQPARGGGALGVETAGAGFPASVERWPESPRDATNAPPRLSVGPVTRAVPSRSPSVSQARDRPRTPAGPPDRGPELPVTGVVPDASTVRAPALTGLPTVDRLLDDLVVPR